MRRHFDRQEPLALAALVAGACAISSSGVLVRLSQTGPTATGFWRGALALPLLAVWAWAEARHRPMPRRGGLADIDKMKPPMTKSADETYGPRPKM